VLVDCARPIRTGRVDFVHKSFIVRASDIALCAPKEKLLRTIRLGGNGPEIAAVGLGCMGMAGGYGPADDGESIATIHAALDAGVTLLDAADFYGAGHTELVLREALKGGRRQRAFVAIKYGAMRDPDGKGLGDDARPAATKNFLAYTLRRLGTDYVDLYQPSRVDPKVPIEDTVGAIADMVKAGHVRHIGAVGGLGQDHPAGTGGAPDRRPADRIFAVHAHDREGHPADRP
jgi:aryl-alcohol dehydrogenase-like predicted oxidoreductase